MQAVLPLKTLPSLPGVDVHAPPEELAGSLLNKYTWHGSASGWMTAAIFADIIRRVFIPEIERRRMGSGRRALLTIDGASSHDSPEVREMLEAAGIDLMLLLPNSTHILQPMDAGVLGPFKQHLGKNLAAMRSSQSSTRRHNFDTVPERRVALLRAAVDAMRSATGSLDIEDAFARTGHFPVDVEQPLKNPKLAETQDLAEEQEKKKAKRTSIPIADGHGVIDIGEIAELAHGAPKKAKKNVEPATTIADEPCGKGKDTAGAGAVDGEAVGAAAAAAGADAPRMPADYRSKGLVDAIAAAMERAQGDAEYKRHVGNAEEMRLRIDVVGAAMGLAMKAQDTPGDGSCQFHAVLEALRHCSAFPREKLPPCAATLRHQTVLWMKRHRNTIVSGRATLEHFAITSEKGQTWPGYLANMARPTTWGDKLTLFAMASMLDLDIRVIAAPNNSPDDSYSCPATAKSSSCVIWLANRGQVHFEWISAEALTVAPHHQ